MENLSTGDKVLIAKYTYKVEGDTWLDDYVDETEEVQVSGYTYRGNTLMAVCIARSHYFNKPSEIKAIEASKLTFVRYDTIEEAQKRYGKT